MARRIAPICGIFLVIGLILLLREQLFVNVLNLALHLLIAALHQVHKHVHHTKRICLLLKARPSQDRVESSIHVGTHLQVVVFHHIREYL